MKNKKADGNVVWIVVILGLLLVFAFVYFGVWKTMFGKSAGAINNQISGAEDSDKDGVINLNDKCKDLAGDIQNEGCPEGWNG